MLKRTFTCRDEKLWKNLYVSLVRPHLEFASTVWNPYLSGDIKALEKVQERALRIPSSFKDLSYEKRQFKISARGLERTDEQK
jgi:ribonuclease P/MRP protein subunit RPP40